MFDQINNYCPPAYWYFTLSLLVNVLIIFGNILVGTFTWMSAIWFVFVILMISFWASVINLLCTNKHTYVAWGIAGFTMLSLIPSIIFTFISDVSLVLHPKIKKIVQPNTMNHPYYNQHSSF